MRSDWRGRTATARSWLAGCIQSLGRDGGGALLKRHSGGGSAPYRRRQHVVDRATVRVQPRAQDGRAGTPGARSGRQQGAPREVAPCWQERRGRSGSAGQTSNLLSHHARAHHGRPELSVTRFACDCSSRSSRSHSRSSSRSSSSRGSSSIISLRLYCKISPAPMQAAALIGAQ